MNPISEAKLEKVLVESGAVNRDQWEHAKSLHARTGQGLEDVLVSEGILKQMELMSQIARSMGVEYVDLESTSINNSAIGRVNGEIAARYHIFPFDIRNNLLFLAMRNQDDLFVIDEIKVFTQMEIKPFLADGRSIGKAIFRYYGIIHKSDMGMPKISSQATETGRTVKISSIIGRNLQRPERITPAAAAIYPVKETGARAGEENSDRKMSDRKEWSMPEEQIQESQERIQSAVEERGQERVRSLEQDLEQEVEQEVETAAVAEHEQEMKTPAAEQEHEMKAPVVEKQGQDKAPTVQQEGMDVLVGKLLQDILKPEHVVDVGIDAVNRTMKVTLVIRY